MTTMLRSFIAGRSLFTWLALCLGATICALVLYDLPAESYAWDRLSAIDVPVWAILGGFALAWVRNLAFWSWLLIVGFVAFRLRTWATTEQVQYAPAPRKLTKPISIIRVVLGVVLVQFLAGVVGALLHN
jgi:hypothetical protein